MNNQETNKKLHRKLVSTAIALLLLAAICICLYTTVQVLSNGYVSVGGYSCFRVITGSMEPSIAVGELIIAKETDISEIQINDIVCYRSESPQMLGSTITHRVVDKLSDNQGKVKLITKGDANLSSDGSFVSENNLLGKVIWNSGNSMISKIMSFLTGKFGFLSCIAFPALIVATLILKDNVKAMKKEINKAVSELEKDDKNKESIPSQNANISKEEYEALCEKLRAELIQELKHIDDSEQNRQ